MTRPIVWALGSCAAFVFAANAMGDRLSRIAASRPDGASQGASMAGSGPARPTAELAGASGRTLTITADRLGHFTVEGSVEGRRIALLVDTGASIVALTDEDARTAGIRPFPSDYTRRMSTANGVVGAAPVRIRELRIGDIVLREVDAVVMPPGRLGQSLLGMSVLRRLRSFDIAGDRLTLRG